MANNTLLLAAVGILSLITAASDRPQFFEDELAAVEQKMRAKQARTRLETLIKSIVQANKELRDRQASEEERAAQLKPLKEEHQQLHRQLSLDGHCFQRLKDQSPK